MLAVPVGGEAGDVVGFAQVGDELDGLEADGALGEAGGEVAALGVPGFGGELAEEGEGCLECGFLVGRECGRCLPCWAEGDDVIAEIVIVVLCHAFRKIRRRPLSLSLQILFLFLW